MIDKVKGWLERESLSYRESLGERRPAIESLSVNGGWIFGGDVLRQSANIIIKASPGSVPGSPDFGVGVSSYLDRPLPETADLSTIIGDMVLRFDARISPTVTVNMAGATVIVYLGGLDADAIQVIV